MATKVFIVNHANEAKYKVFFVKHDNEQKNHQILLGGKLVKQANEADVKVYIVNHANEATILITVKNFPQ